MTDSSIQNPGFRWLLLWVLALLVAVPLGGQAASPDPTGPQAVPGPSAIGNYLAGRHADAQRDRASAAVYLGVALREIPDAPDLLRRTMVLMAMEQKFDEAVDLSERLLARKPKEPMAHLILAVDAFRREDWKLLERRLTTQPENGLSGLVAPLLRAWALVARKKYDLGLKALKPLDGNAGSQGFFDMHSALINDLAGRAKAAEAGFGKIIEAEAKFNAKKPKHETVRNFRLVQHFGQFYERLGKESEARALYDRFVADVPGTTLLKRAYGRLENRAKPLPLMRDARSGAAEALFSIADFFRSQRGLETALVISQIAIWLKPQFPIAQMLVGRILDADQRYAAANAIYAAIGTGSAFRISADLRRAQNLNSLKQTEAAIGLLKDLAARLPKDPQPLSTLGDLLRRHERWEEAIEVYTGAMARVGTIEKRHWRMLYTRGIVFERAKRWPDAEKDFLKALEFEPDQPYVLNYLGYSWVDRGVHLDRALDMIIKAVKLRPNDGYIIDSLGWVYYRLGNYKKAVLELERAVQIRPEDPIINDHLGDGYWRVGRKLEARFQWQRALSLEPTDEVAEAVRKKLKEGLPPAKPVGVPDAAGEAATPDKT